MLNPFVFLYKFLLHRRGLFYLIIVSSIVGIVFYSSKVQLRENLSAFIPKDPRVKEYQEIIKNLKANDRLVVHMALKDSTKVDPEKLISASDAFADSIRLHFDSTWVSEIKYKIEDEDVGELFYTIYNNLPYFLDEKDYVTIAKMTSDSAIGVKLEANYQALLSPEGIAYKEFLQQDPLGLNSLALQKLIQLQTDANIELYNGYLISKDKKHLLLYISTAYPSNDGEKNGQLYTTLEKLVASIRSNNPEITIEYVGSPVIAAANMMQIKSDAFITTVVAVVIILVGLWLYFKNIKTLLLIFSPVLFGAGFALSLIYLIQKDISAIAIGAGAVVLGIAIDYSLHFFTHLNHERKIQQVISHLTVPLTIGCTTTVGAFFCLQFMQSEALRDMGLFAGLSLLGAALFCLLFLPHMVSEKNDTATSSSEVKWIYILDYPFHRNKFLLILIAIVTVITAFYCTNVGFETDMTKLSYSTPDMEKAEQNLDVITQYKLKSVYLLSQGKTLEEAIRFHNDVLPLVNKMQEDSIVQKVASPAAFMLTEKQYNIKTDWWFRFWTKEKRENVLNSLQKHSSRIGFADNAFPQFIQLIHTSTFSSASTLNEFMANSFLKEFVNSKNNQFALISVLKTEANRKANIYEAFQNINHTFVVDRGSTAAMFAKILHEDFQLILLICSVLVFSVLFISYGRIELAVLAFLPMFISWIWILGFMNLAGIDFNIVNIILCTFIFGLGDDYSIFTVDGLEREYLTGKKQTSSYRHSIILSAFTTIVGIGVLIFAKHPALQSIASVTIIGIVSIVFISMVVQPFIYDLLVLKRKEKKLLPITIYSILAYIELFLLILFTNAILAITKGADALKYVSFLVKRMLFWESNFGEQLNEFVTNMISKKASPIFEQLYFENKRLLKPENYYAGIIRKNYVLKGPVLEWYTRIKMKLENNYALFNKYLPTTGTIVDVGCGYGYLSYMLAFTHKNRTVLGLDYDEEKIATAQHGAIRPSNLSFAHADVTTYTYTPSDAFVISDVLHYLKEEQQLILIQKCVENLRANGILIIRDGNSKLEKKHKGTVLTEWFSTKLIGFNKVEIEQLCFTNEDKIKETLSSYAVSVEILDETKYTSNVVYIIRKNM